MNTIERFIDCGHRATDFGCHRSRCAARSIATGQQYAVPVGELFNAIGQSLPASIGIIGKPFTVTGEVFKQLVTKDQPVPATFLPECLDFPVSHFQSPGTEITAEFKFAELAPQ